MRAKKIDGTIPVPALLHEGETIIASQDGVGIYEGTQKLPEYQNGSIHLTSHRIFYVDARDLLDHSFFLNLKDIGQTEYYTGFLTSSPKVTLFSDSGHTNQGSNEDAYGNADDADDDAVVETWICQVCSNRNTVGINAYQVCSLCGVGRQATASGTSGRQSTIPATIPPSRKAQSMHDLSDTLRGTEPASIACSACTFLNHPSLAECELCSTPLVKVGRASPRHPISLRSSPRPPRSSSPAYLLSSSGPSLSESDIGIMKLSFRKGGDKAWYESLKEQLTAKSWLAKKPIRLGPSTGIRTILQTADLDAQLADENMTDALQDLKALMSKAKDMVAFTSALNSKLIAQEGRKDLNNPSSFSTSSLSETATIHSSDAQTIRSSLATLGLPIGTKAVTLDMVKDDKEWIDELAQELSSLLQSSDKESTSSSRIAGGALVNRGIVGLDEVWGGWNRARGVALIPPSTFLQVLPQLPAYTKPIVRLRHFKSGLMTLHTPEFVHEAFTSRILFLISSTGPKSIVQIASEEGISVGLAQEMMDCVEDDGEVLRDLVEDGIEVKWWVNSIRNWEWDGG